MEWPYPWGCAAGGNAPSPAEGRTAEPSNGAEICRDPFRVRHDRILDRGRTLHRALSRHPPSLRSTKRYWVHTTWAVIKLIDMLVLGWLVWRFRAEDCNCGSFLDSVAATVPPAEKPTSASRCMRGS